jgi:hypothetical protein
LLNLTPGGTNILDCTDEIDTTEISVFCQFLRFFLNSGIPVFTLKSIGCRRAFGAFPQGQSETDN